jgi:hypothetical protein
MTALTSGGPVAKKAFLSHRPNRLPDVVRIAQ